MKQRWLLVLVSLALVLGVVGFAPVGVTRAAPSATCTWTGGTTAWATPSNWDCGVVPGASDVAEIGTAPNNPSVTDTRAVGTLTIKNGGVLTISGAAGFLTVGNGVTGNNDITIQSGGEIDNLSTAGAGTPFALATANDIFRIDNGGKYLHNTARSFGTPFPIAQCSFDVNSTVEFGQNSPTTATLSGRTYGNLTLSATSAKTYTASAGGTNVIVINGTLTLASSNVTFNPNLTSSAIFTLGGITNSGGTLNFGASTMPVVVSGNIVNNGTLTTSGSVTFIGPSAQTISGSNVTAFNNLVISNTAKVVFPSTNIPTVAGTMTVNPGAVLTQTATINNGSFSFLIISDTLNNNKFRSVDVSSFNNLGAVTATLVVTTTGGCTSTGIGSPAYATRCYRITPQYPNNTATVKLWALSSELNGLTVDTVAPYHYSGGSWTKLTNVVTGTVDSYTFAQGDTTSFSPFLLGNTNNAPNAITLTTFSGSTPTNDGLIAVILLAAAALLAGGWVLRRRTQA